MKLMMMMIRREWCLCVSVLFVLFVAVIVIGSLALSHLANRFPLSRSPFLSLVYICDGFSFQRRKFIHI